MALQNYWWLLIWLFPGGWILGKWPRRRERLGSETVERWDHRAALLLVLPYMIWAGFRQDHFGDTALYRNMFLGTADDLSGISAVFSDGGKDPGFRTMMIVLRWLLGDGDVWFFLVIAAFQLCAVSLFFRRYAADYWTCVFLFVVSTDYLSWMYNGIRQFCAVAIILAGFPLLIEKRYLPMSLVILLASLFHGSALLMFPVMFVVQGEPWNRKTLLMLLGTAVVIAFVDPAFRLLAELLVNTPYGDVIENEIWVSDDGTSLLRVAIYAAPALLSLIGYRQVRRAHDPVMHICVNCAIVTMALYLISAVSSGVYIGRLPIYTTLPGYAALPWMIDRIFEPRSAKLVRGVMYGAYLAFFYFQMHLVWGVL